MRIALAVTQTCFSSGVAALLDILGTAEAHRADVDTSIPPLRLRVLAPDLRVTTSSGMDVPVDGPLSDLGDHDVVVVPAMGTMTGDDTLAGLRRADARAVVAAISDLAPTAHTVAAACTGVFPVAEAGWLERRRATTSWWLWPAFRQRYPSVTLDVDAMVVADDHVVTAGAAFAHIDLALALVRRHSAALADHVAQLLVIDQRPSQSAYIAIDHLVHNDPLVLAFEHHARAHLSEPLDIGDVATAIGTSRRTLERRTAAALGMSPLSVIQRLRVERAEHLARTTGRSLQRIASEVGYANASTLRALMRRLR
ncbi:MAG TPA: helix-turn-helix domain-containing protein [Euzebyales bacterium]|nr:helix-turn-helix domain-containing protein [Euzebyales bacterium]